MVLVEAEILNKYILITDTAAREVVKNYGKSLIVPNNEDGIYEGIKELVLNKEKLSENKDESSYNNNAILDEIKCMIENID